MKFRPEVQQAPNLQVTLSAWSFYCDLSELYYNHIWLVTISDLLPIQQPSISITQSWKSFVGNQVKYYSQRASTVLLLYFTALYFTEPKIRWEGVYIYGCGLTIVSCVWPSVTILIFIRQKEVDNLWMKPAIGYCEFFFPVNCPPLLVKVFLLDQ